MKKILFLLFSLFAFSAFGQVVYLGGYTSTQINGITPGSGYPILYNTTDSEFQRWNGASWEPWGGASIPISDEGTQQTPSVTSFNFTGGGITASSVGNAVTVNVPGAAGNNSNIFVPSAASDFTSPDPANIGKIWELQSDIDLGGATVDLSTYNITLKDGGGCITNFESIDLGTFHTEGSPVATYFCQPDLIAGDKWKGIVNGTIDDEIVYVNWFSPFKNGNLESGGSLNGAKADHIAIQNAFRVIPTDNGTVAFPANAFLMQGDGSNPEYSYTNNPYTGIPVGGNITVEPDGSSITVPDTTGVDQSFVFENYTNITILGNNATVVANPNQSIIANNRGFKFRTCENVVIKDLTYDGNLEEREPYISDASGWNDINAFLFLGCINPVLENVVAKYAIMDGFSFRQDGEANPPLAGKYGRMDNCKALYSYRQGMTVASHWGMEVYNSEFSYTGKVISDEAVPGCVDCRPRWLTTSPSAGIDMEASTTYFDERSNQDWLFEGCLFRDNHGAGLSPHWGSRNTTVRNCTFITDELFEPQDRGNPTTTGNNNYINNVFYDGILDSQAGGALIVGNQWYIDSPQTVYLNFPADSTVTTNVIALNVEDQADMYADGNVRKAIIRDNIIKLEPDSLQVTNTTLGRVNITHNDVVFENNHFYNAHGIQANGNVNTILTVSGTLSSFVGNRWELSSDAVIKWAGNGNYGRMLFNSEILYARENFIDPLYQGNDYEGYYYEGGLRGSLRPLEAGNPWDYDTIREGATFYDTDDNALYYWNGTTWVAI